MKKNIQEVNVVISDDVGLIIVFIPQIIELLKIVNLNANQLCKSILASIVYFC